VAFANDANCFALAEATWGSARDGRVVFGVILGTGVGGGLVFRESDGRATAWEGAQGIAGEWGHVVLDPEHGLPCYCGRRGCIETFLSGPALEAAYAKETGVDASLVDIGRSQAPEARAFLRARMDVFGRALATVIDVVDPDVIVLGGGVSNLDVLYAEGRDAIARWVFNDTLETRLVKHALGDSAGVIGAAMLPR
jgi:fructokinase